MTFIKSKLKNHQRLYSIVAEGIVVEAMGSNTYDVFGNMTEIARLECGGKVTH